MSLEDFSGYFNLHCHLYKIYKSIPGIANNVSFLEFDHELPKEVPDNNIMMSKAIPVCFVVPNIAFTENEVSQFVSKFKSILTKPELIEYNLGPELDNILLVCLHLYTVEWDAESYSFNTPNSNKLFDDLTDSEKPPSFKNASKAQQLAKFLKLYFEKDIQQFNNAKSVATPTLTLKWGSQEAVIKDTAIFHSMLNDIFAGLMSNKDNWNQLNETYGEIGTLLLLDVNRQIESGNLERLPTILDQVLDARLTNPFPLRNVAIYRFCLILKHYLNQAKLVPTKSDLPKPMLILFAEILHLFDMKFGNHPYDSEEFRQNLSRSIRDYRDTVTGKKHLKFKGNP